MKRSARLYCLHIAILGVVVVYYVLLYVFGVTCPIRALIGYPCPACGMSRAMVSLLFLDFEGYAYYNAMALPVLLGALSAIHFGKDKSLKAFFNVYLIVIAVINAVYYAVRLSIGTAS